MLVGSWRKKHSAKQCACLKKRYNCFCTCVLYNKGELISKIDVFKALILVVLLALFLLGSTVCQCMYTFSTNMSFSGEIPVHVLPIGDLY